MTIEEAARRLSEMYLDPATDRAVSVHLLAIRYVDELRGMNQKELAARAAIPDSYATEIRKGIKLSEYVVEK